MKKENGFWISEGRVLVCSNCGHVIGNSRLPNYCSQCGSKMVEMREEKENEFSNHIGKNNKGL